MAALLSLELARTDRVTVVSLYDRTGSWIEAELSGLPLQFLGKKPGLDPRLVPRLRATMRALRPDVVHTHLHTLKYALTAVRPSRIVHTLHNLAEREIEPHSRPVHALAFRLGARPVAIGDAVAESIRAVYRQEPEAIIPNGIRVADFDVPPGTREEVRAELGLEGPVFLAVGRLNPQKDPLGLLAAFERVPGTLLLAGDGELRDAVVARAGPRVRVLGVRRDIPRLFAACDALVLASRWEGNPLVVMEAMAAGRPVVATAVGCVPELVPAGAGVLVPHGDPAALGAALSLYADTARAAADGLEARRHAVTHFDVSVMAARYRALFAEGR
jgi:glycosyltransferase involved in cell wall biosynthesis